MAICGSKHGAAPLLMKLSPQEFADGLLALGVTPHSLAAVRHAESEEQALERLDALKTRARRAFRDAALQCHPDMTGGDNTKTARFRWLRETLDQFELTKVATYGHVRGKWVQFDGEDVLSGGFREAVKSMIRREIRPHVEQMLREFKADAAARYQLLIPDRRE